jgi:hypothetical protein
VGSVSNGVLVPEDKLKALQSENLALRKLVEEANDLMTETVDYDENPEKYKQWLQKAGK